MNKVLMEKYEFSEQDAKDLADFLVPILDFVPEKRPTAAQCLIHPWITGSRLLEPPLSGSQPQAMDSCTSDKKREKDDREAMEFGVGNMVINGGSEPGKEANR